MVSDGKQVYYLEKLFRPERKAIHRVKIDKNQLSLDLATTILFII